MKVIEISTIEQNNKKIIKGNSIINDTIKSFNYQWTNLKESQLSFFNNNMFFSTFICFFKIYFKIILF